VLGGCNIPALSAYPGQDNNPAYRRCSLRKSACPVAVPVQYWRSTSGHQCAISCKGLSPLRVLCSSKEDFSYHYRRSLRSAGGWPRAGCFLLPQLSLPNIFPAAPVLCPGCFSPTAFYRLCGLLLPFHSRHFTPFLRKLCLKCFISLLVHIIPQMQRKSK